jgi:diguanylate cyclase (GGDEF)-like protein
MSSFPVLIILGPCLLMVFGAVAQLVIHRYLSRVQHARIWAAAFLAGAAQWAMVGLSGLIGKDPFRSSLIADLLGLTSALLFAWGFRGRAGHGSLLLPVVAIAGGLLLIGTSFLADLPARSAIYPMITGVILGGTALQVTPSGARAWPIERATAVLLWLLVLLCAIAVLLAVAEQSGWLAGHRTYLLLLTAAVEPACAAVSLFTLLLIAQDFWIELRRLVHTDPLTGVLNRLGFNHAVRALKGCRWRQRPVSLCIADIDGFKQINDDHGHAAGDAALKRFAAHIAGWLEQHESVARIGGEEFALLLPGLDGHRATERIERLRASLSDIAVDDHPTISVRASFGVTECARGELIETVIERADRALYRSKHDGRDRVTLVEPALHA